MVKIVIAWTIIPYVFLLGSFFIIRFSDDKI